MGNYLVIPELAAGITILDQENQSATTIGFNSEVASRNGWPNERSLVTEGKFNSPHSAAVDHDGNIYVVEWISEGRLIKLERIKQPN